MRKQTGGLRPAVGMAVTIEGDRDGAVSNDTRSAKASS